MTPHPYSTHAYAEALDHWGKPLSVPEWGVTVLVRDIDLGGQDATGPYPITPIAADADLAGGLARLSAEGLISVTLVLDNACKPSGESLEQYFDIYRVFKPHFIHPAGAAPMVSKHHRYEIKQARSRLEVRPIALADHCEEFWSMYQHLKARHGLSGVHDFPGTYFERLAALDGVVTLAAFLEHKMVGAHIFVAHRQRLTSHLSATCETGYRLGAAYIINDEAIQLYGQTSTINFGGVAGAGSDARDGLARFKRGFTPATEPSYLCGAVLDPERYAGLVARAGVGSESAYFPQYRTPKA